MATRKIIKVVKTKAKDLPWRIVMECGHSRYLAKEYKVGDTFKCTQKKCKWDFD